MRFIISISFFLIAFVSVAAAPALKPPMPMHEAFRLQARRDGPDVVLSWRLEDGYYLYREYLKATDAHGKPVALSTPPGVIKEDPGYGSTEVYYGTATATITWPVNAPLNVTYQGCQDGGLCYPPVTVDVNDASMAESREVAAGKGFDPTGPGSESAYPLGSKAEASSTTWPAVRISEQSADGVVGSLLQRGGVSFLIIGVVGLGVLLAFTACAISMYPILAATLSRKGKR
ncbi:protein-disulfide reductase DsbD domain-containing protein [Rhizobium daejeonense]